MKISHEVPRCLLTVSPKFNKYNYCLPHLLDIDKEYEAFFRSEKEQGRYCIMDNSLHELSHAYDNDRLIYWVNELEPDEFIVPDVWMDCTKTILEASHWMQLKLPKKTKLIAVIQGHNEHEAYLCADLLYGLGYNKLCVSYGATWYNDFFPHSNVDMGKALGRVRFVQSLLQLKHLEDLKLHLLGCTIPSEFGWYDNHPQIESIDTSNPIMAALEGIKYKSYGLNSKPKANMNDHFDMEYDELDYSIVLYNVEKFKQINNLSSNNHD